MEATLSSNLKSSGEEIEHLKEHMASSSEDARAKLAPRLERLKAEFHKHREKLAEHLEADLKKTKEDMEKLGEATENSARLAKEKLSKKVHELGTGSKSFTKRTSPTNRTDPQITSGGVSCSSGG